MSVAKGTVEISRANARKIIADLPTLLEPNAVVFDVETTGLNSRWHEIVSFAARSPTDAVGTSTFIMPKRPNDLLKASDSGKSAYDINGIHLDDLVGSPTFEEAYPKIRQALEGKHWVCWNADFDVNFLDTVCDKRGVERIPRAGVTCAMKLLSPLAGLRGQRRGRIETVRVSDTADDRYRWQKLSSLAKRMGIDTRKAHDAIADVDITIAIMNWASENLQSLPALRKTSTNTASRKAKQVPNDKREKASLELTISASEREQILDENLFMCQDVGKCLESRVGFSAVVVTPKSTNHVLHLIISLVSGGLWLPVWLVIALKNKDEREILHVDEYGNVTLTPAKGRVLVPK